MDGLGVNKTKFHFPPVLPSPIPAHISQRKYLYRPNPSKMGCSSSREENPLEVSLTAVQNRLGFQDCAVEEVASAFETWSLGQIVLHKHMQAIIRKFDLTFDSPEAVHLLTLLSLPSPASLSPDLLSLLPTLPSDFQSSTDPVYSKHLLIILSCLLSKGTNTAKGKAIIQCFDEKCTGEFYEPELKTVVREMYRVACEVVPELMKAEDWTEEMKEYVGNTRKGVDKAVEKSVAFLLDRRRSINVDEFSDKFEEYQGSEMSHFGGLRKLAAAAALSPLPPTALAKD